MDRDDTGKVSIGQLRFFTQTRVFLQRGNNAAANATKVIIQLCTHFFPLVQNDRVIGGFHGFRHQAERHVVGQFDFAGGRYKATKNFISYSRVFDKCSTFMANNHQIKWL